MAAAPERYLTAAETGEYFGGIPASWFEIKARERVIPSHYIGKHLRFSPGDIAEIGRMFARTPHQSRAARNSGRLRTA